MPNILLPGDVIQMAYITPETGGRMYAQVRGRIVGTDQIVTFDQRDDMPDSVDRSQNLVAFEESVQDPVEVLSAVVKAEATTVSPYSIYAQLEVDEGQDFCHGYVHQHADLQLGVFQGPHDPWWARTVEFTLTRNAGDTFTDTVPDNASRRLEAVTMFLTTDSNVADRSLAVELESRESGTSNIDQLARIEHTTTIPASSTGQASFARGVGGLSHATDELNVLPDTVLVDEEGYTYDVKNIEAGDVLELKGIYTEWLGDHGT